MVILAVAMVLVGPSDLPKVTRWIARVFKAIRVAIKDFSEAISLDEDIKEVKEAGKMLRETVHDLNPVTELTDEIEKTRRETKEAFSVLGDLNKKVLDTDTKTTKAPRETGGAIQDTREV